MYTEDVVDLNIGGTHLISTTKNTLTSVKDSSLAAMFSGRHRITTHNGRFFIDRDVEAFTNMLVSLLKSFFILLKNIKKIKIATSR